jgi:UTP-glucose-1-phosphate uridylyltransferase
MHYLLQCRVFAAMRTVLINRITDLYMTKNIALDLRRTLVQKELVNALLKGDARFDEGENTQLFTTVQDYILATKRF